MENQKELVMDGVVYLEPDNMELKNKIKGIQVEDLSDSKNPLFLCNSIHFYYGDDRTLGYEKRIVTEGYLVLFSHEELDAAILNNLYWLELHQKELTELRHQLDAFGYCVMYDTDIFTDAYWGDAMNIYKDKNVDFYLLSSVQLSAKTYVGEYKDTKVKTVFSQGMNLDVLLPEEVFEGMEEFGDYTSKTEHFYHRETVNSELVTAMLQQHVQVLGS